MLLSDKALPRNSCVWEGFFVRFSRWAYDIRFFLDTRFVLKNILNISTRYWKVYKDWIWEVGNESAKIVFWFHVKICRRESLYRVYLTSISFSTGKDLNRKFLAGRLVPCFTHSRNEERFLGMNKLDHRGNYSTAWVGATKQLTSFWETCGKVKHQVKRMHIMCNIEILIFETSLSFHKQKSCYVFFQGFM